MLQLHTPQEAANWLRSRVTGSLQTDSRKLQPGDGFIAWPGEALDARQFVAHALSSGAQACLVERLGAQAFDLSSDQVAAYPDLKAASGPIAAAYFDQPSRQLDVLAVTGTNGKTSTAWWLAQALSNLTLVAPIPCALVGTLGIGIAPLPGAPLDADPLAGMVATGLTTPDPVQLQQALRHFVERGLQACALEASSIGLEEQRLSGTRIRTAIFTNFTQDHLDYHGAMADYWQAKARLFQWPGLQSAVINIDDEQGVELATALRGQALDLWTVSCLTTARLQASDIVHGAQGLRFALLESKPIGANGAGAVGESHVLQTRLIGSYNVANLLGVIAAMRCLNVPLAAAVAACADLSPVPGRMECWGAPSQPLAAVDYAHTPDALAKALLALRPLADQRGGKLWCVFGCGGDRDAAKRPLMGAIAASHADCVVVTSDNPRSEKPDAIISQILLGLCGHPALSVEPERALAIAQALAQAAPEDVLLIAGKGHEDYQEVAGRRLPFSDAQQVRLALGRWVAPATEPAADTTIAPGAQA